MALTTLDPALDSLLARYVRGERGADEVLDDALLERGSAPLPLGGDASARLGSALGVITGATRTAIGCACVRRVLPRVAGELVGEASPTGALAALEATGPGEAARHAAFKAFIACGKRKCGAEASRVAWATWMIARDMTAEALASLRSAFSSELDAQIDLVARTLGG